MTFVDDDDLARLYAASCPPLIGLLTLIGGSRADAEEVAHDAFVRLIDHWSSVRTYDDPAAWVRRVAVRLLVSRKRRQQVAARMLGRLGAGSETDAAGPDGTGVDLDRALAALSTTHRAVLVLHHGADLPLDEVAELLGVPVGTVKSRLSRARAAATPLLDDLERSDHA